MTLRQIRALVSAVALSVLVGPCSDDGSPSAHPVAPLEIGPGEVAIPPGTVDGMALETLRWADPDLGAGGFRSPTVVSRTDGGVVAVSTIDEEAAAAQGFTDLEEWGEIGPGVNGAQAYVTTGLGPVPMGSIIYRPQPGTWVEVGSRELEPMELAAVAVDIALPIDQPGAVPGDVIGSFTGTHQLLLPDAVHAHYQDEDNGMSLTVAAATPAQQAAILAVVYEDPDTQIDPMTEASCCSEQVFRPPRQRQIRGQSATIATLTPHIVVLVVEGDPGLVLTTVAPQPGGGIPVDDQLAAVAEKVSAGTPRQLDDFIEAVDARRLDRQVARIRAREQELGWDVVATHHGTEQGVVISTGDGPRPELDLPGQALCAVVVGGNPPSCLTGSSGILTPGSDGVDVTFGAVSEEVAVVRLDMPGGTREAEIYELDGPEGLPDRVYIAALGLAEMGRLTDSFNAADEAEIVAIDADGHELARAPMFEHLQGR